MYIHTYVYTYIHMNVITSARGKVILIYRDVKTCTVVCDKVCTYIAGSSICTSCDAGKYQATAGDESVFVRGREGEVLGMKERKKARSIYVLGHLR